MDEDAEMPSWKTLAAAPRRCRRQPDTIAMATSFTEALNQVAWWLRPGRGQNIVSSEVDFPSVTTPGTASRGHGCQARGGG